MAIFTTQLGSGAPEQFVKLAVDVDVVALVSERDDLVGPGQERSGGVAGSHELGLAEGRRQREVQHLVLAFLARPDLDVTLTSRTLQADGQQVAGKDPLDGLIGPNMECHADRVGVLSAVVEARHERDGSVVGNYQVQAEFGGHGHAAVHHRGQTFALWCPGLPGFTYWCALALSHRTSRIPLNWFRGILIPRKKSLVTSVTGRQTGYDVVKRFTQRNTDLDAGSSRGVTGISCDLRLTRGREGPLLHRAVLRRIRRPRGPCCFHREIASLSS